MLALQKQGTEANLRLRELVIARERMGEVVADLSETVSEVSNSPNSLETMRKFSWIGSNKISNMKSASSTKTATDDMLVVDK